VNGAVEKPEVSAVQRALIRVAGWAHRNRRRAATVLVVLAALGFGYNAVFGVNGINMFEHKRAEDRAIQQRIDKLKQENKQLEQNVQELRSDPDAIEHEARERLHYARPGEVIWTENGPENSQQPAAGSQPKSGQQ
jgi:cell division protein FtsB